MNARERERKGGRREAILVGTVRDDNNVAAVLGRRRVLKGGHSLLAPGEEFAHHVGRGPRRRLDFRVHGRVLAPEFTHARGILYLARQRLQVAAEAPELVARPRPVGRPEHGANGRDGVLEIVTLAFNVERQVVRGAVAATHGNPFTGKRE